MTVIVLSVKPGEEVLSTLTRRGLEEGVTDGAVVSLIGAVDRAVISNMPADDATADALTEYRQPCELTGTGEIVDGVVHLHVVLGRERNVPVAGHLHEAQVETHFVRAYVLPVSGQGFGER